MTQDTLRQWDQKIAPLLQRIEQCAAFSQYYALEAAYAAKRLPEHPEWESNAGSALAEAEKEIRKAVEIINGKREAARLEGKRRRHSGKRKVS